jgi:hypothetical protein
VPTYAVDDRFWGDWERLDDEDRPPFWAALGQFIECLVAWERGGFQGLPRFPHHLGVKPMKGHSGIWEMAWSPDGRCTWEYGTREVAGKAHIVWRRIGSHRIYDDP